MAKQLTNSSPEDTVDNRSAWLAVLFGALSTSTRLSIVKRLQKKKQMSVTSIAEDLNISMPAASHQLKTLEIAGLVKSERAGKTTHYSLNLNGKDPAIKKVLDILK